MFSLQIWPFPVEIHFEPCTSENMCLKATNALPITTYTCNNNTCTFLYAVSGERPALDLQCFSRQNENTGQFSFLAVWSIIPNGQNLTIISETLSYADVFVRVKPLGNSTFGLQTLLVFQHLVVVPSAQRDESISSIYILTSNFSGSFFVHELSPEFDGDSEIVFEVSVL